MAEQDERSAVDALLDVGALMSNLLFNLGQDEKQTAHTIMRELQRDWDVKVQAYRAGRRSTPAPIDGTCAREGCGRLRDDAVHVITARAIVHSGDGAQRPTHQFIGTDDGPCDLPRRKGPRGPEPMHTRPCRLHMPYLFEPLQPTSAPAPAPIEKIAEEIVCVVRHDSMRHKGVQCDSARFGQHDHAMFKAIAADVAELLRRHFTDDKEGRDQ